MNAVKIDLFFSRVPNQVFVWLKQNVKKKTTDLTALAGGEELDKNPADRISLEQMHLF